MSLLSAITGSKLLKGKRLKSKSTQSHMAMLMTDAF
ncbi:hypothetical protein TELCIR_23179 [Teladorsagia circumcincta]|uniref:Uncharacterized protein n=1 Tax=Teladorsagia circumcincta TaxID=45464 RepID=A0A2G9TBW7_TELCI|nr:hypothetical protein TELCIR_23179 [Teladorsagia circumcincta]